MSKLPYQKALIIKGTFNNILDMVRIARKEGKKALHTKKVRVLPYCYPFGKDHIMVVELES